MQSRRIPQSVCRMRERRRQFDPHDPVPNRGIIYKLFSAYFLKDLINIHARQGQVVQRKKKSHSSAQVLDME